MKTVFLLLFVCACFFSNSQVFYTENFTTGGAGWNLASVQGAEGADPNFFKVSANEGGGITPNLGAPGSCGVANNGNNTMHVTSVFNPNGGAAYDAGGLCGFLFCPLTNRRAESPTINCTGKTTISVNFNFIEGGQGTTDNATLWYFDGTIWAQIDNMPKTLLGCGGQGLWTSRTVALPASANNNPGVRIGFRWVNNDDGAGSDPSFAVDDITLSTPIVSSAPVADFSTPSTTICAGQCINFTDLSTNTPTSWSWSFTGAATTTSTLQNPTGICYNAAGTYTVSLTATNASGSNMMTKNNYITVVATPTLTVSPTSATLCAGSTRTLSASGATNYTWAPAAGLTSTNTAATTFTGTSSGSYTVIGANGTCTASATTSLTVIPNPTVSVSPASATLCAGSTQNLLASGATNYTWTPATGLTSANTAATTFTGTSSQSYTLAGSNGSCTSFTIVSITVVPNPTVSVNPNNPTVCPGGTQTLTASGATSYSWIPATGLTSTGTANTTFTGNVSSSYTVTGQTGSCSSSTVVSITVGPSLSLTVSPVSPGVCAGSTQTLVASGATNYTWSPAAGLTSTNTAATTFTASTSNTYTVTGTSGSCSGTATVAVTVVPLPVISISPASATLCAGSTQTLSASGGTSYTWTPSAGLTSSVSATPTFTGNTSTTYTVRATNNGCVGSNSVSITVNTAPIVNTTPHSFTVCAGSSVVFNASGATTYTWNPATGLSSAFSATPSHTASATTNYTVTGTGANGCTDTALVRVVVNPLPVVNASPRLGSICGGIPLTLTASGATNYTWTPGSGLSSTNTASTSCSAASNISYTVTGTDANGCSDTAVVFVTVGSLNISVSSPTVICEGNPANLLVGGANSYTWQPAASLNNAFVANPVASPTSTTIYTVTGSNGSCAGTQTVMVTVNPLPVVSFTYSVPDTGPPVTITFYNHSTGANNYTWGFSGGTPVAGSTSNPSQSFGAGTYTVSLITTSASGCTDTLQSVFSIADSSFVIMPNVFTPNEDGVNDVFRPILSGIETLSCGIYDRWGLIMYEFSKPNGFWDGRTTSGEACSDGYYFYILEATGIDGTKYKLKGHLTLVR